jgi:Protein of unknown function (DUF3995)
MIKFTTSKATASDSAKRTWVGYGAALWALIFAALHVAWAMGFYVGLDQPSARQAFQRRWFLVYDLIAAGLCVLALAVALALVQKWDSQLPYSLLRMLAWGGTALLALRGGAGIAQDVYVAAFKKTLPGAAAFWDVWFCLGAMLFGISVWQFRRASSPMPLPRFRSPP